MGVGEGSNALGPQSVGAPRMTVRQLLRMGGNCAGEVGVRAERIFHERAGRRRQLCETESDEWPPTIAGHSPLRALTEYDYELQCRLFTTVSRWSLTSRWRVISRTPLPS